MSMITADTLHIRREEDRQSLHQNHRIFRDLVAQSRAFVHAGNDGMAASYAEMAAVWAVARHPGLFASPELEQIVTRLGRRLPSGADKRRPSSSGPRHILHLTNSVSVVTGHNKMIWRWVRSDIASRHSLVLTRQPRRPNVPAYLKQAVNGAGGKIYRINDKVGGLIHWARELRRLTLSFDHVVVHSSLPDVVMAIALANVQERPPVIFIDATDHLFWLGASVSDVVVNLRESGRHLALKRRGVDSARSYLLPTILERSERVFSRAAAKRQLGLPEDCVMLLSVARAKKYRTIDGTNFAEIHLPLLARYPQLLLVVVGPGKAEDWSDAIRKSQHKIIVETELDDVSVYFQAADIYVDSFPFVSITSLLEAGSYGTPLVSRFPYSDDAEILGADMPGLTGRLIRAHSLAEYMDALSYLVENPEHRLRLGAATRQQILAKHAGENLQDAFLQLYELSMRLPRMSALVNAQDEIYTEEPDVFIQRIFGNDLDLNGVFLQGLRGMPLSQHLRHWIRLLTAGAFKAEGAYVALKTLIPEWLICRMR